MSDAKRLFRMDSTGMVSSFRPATADEIKAAHAKCGTCVHCHVFLREYTVESMPALQPVTYAECFRGDPDEPTPDVDIHLDYCRHHEPRENL